MFEFIRQWFINQKLKRSRGYIGWDRKKKILTVKDIVWENVGLKFNYKSKKLVGFTVCIHKYQRRLK